MDIRGGEESIHKLIIIFFLSLVFVWMVASVQAAACYHWFKGGLLNKLVVLHCWKFKRNLKTFFKPLTTQKVILQAL